MQIHWHIHDIHVNPGESDPCEHTLTVWVQYRWHITDQTYGHVHEPKVPNNLLDLNSVFRF